MVNVHGSGLPTSNPNLLINGWFRINQRGQQSYTGNNTYTVDRWRLLIEEGIVTLQNDKVDAVTLFGGYFFQPLNVADIAREMVTLSFECENVTTDSLFLTEDGATAETHRDVQIHNGMNTHTFTVKDVLRGVFIWGTGSFRPLRTKLELGTISTLMHDAPPDPALELAKCQRYYFDSRYGNAPGYGVYARDLFRYRSDHDHWCTGCTFPVPMRTIPAIQIYSGEGCTLGKVANNKYGTDMEAVLEVQGVGMNGIKQLHIIGAGVEDDAQASFYVVADAEIY